jgi:peptidoglycan/xylan/chitin deacetylase (PgdA/CDA1 family)
MLRTLVVDARGRHVKTNSRLDLRMRADEERSELERLLAPLTSVRVVESADSDLEPVSGAITCRVGGGNPLWFRDGDWRVFGQPSTVNEHAAGDELAAFALPDGKVVRALADEGERTAVVPFSLPRAYENYVSEAWRGSTRATELAPRLLDAFYRVKPLVPRRLQLATRRSLVRRQLGSEFPAWPWDEGVIRLLSLYVRSALSVSDSDELAFRWFWPHGHNAALTLGHDVESEEGLRLAVELADLEEELGFRSVFNLGSWYRIDDGIVRELTERGFELGLHGVRHDRALFASRAEFDRQRPLLAANAARLGADGFRSPSTYRVFDWLGELPVAYDASISHSDPFEAQPGGCASVWPFFIGPVVELPYTLPQDHTLFTLLRASSVDLWLEQADRIERHHGLIHCVSHPDRGYLGDRPKRELYADFLRAMTDRSGLWRALPRDVARWWRLRDESIELKGPLVQGVVRRTDEPGGVVFDCTSTGVSDVDLTDDLATTLERVRAEASPDQGAPIGPT